MIVVDNPPKKAEYFFPEKGIASGVPLDSYDIWKIGGAWVMFL